MAEIDKGLPNVRQQIKVPSQDEMTEVATQLQESMPSPDDTEIRENEDGSVDINFEPGVVAPEQAPKHCLLYTSPSPRDRQKSRMPSSA